MSLFSNKKTEGISLLIDIGSYSLGGALIIFSNGNVPQIVFSKRISLPLNEDWNMDKSLDSISKNLETLLKIVFNESSKKLSIDPKKLQSRKVKEVLCVMSSPWCLSKIKSISLKKEKPVNISSKLMDLIAQKSENPESNEKGYSLIEKKIIQTRLNGYITNKPLNKKAKEIEISTFEGMVLNDAALRVKDQINRFVPEDVMFHSFTLSAFSTIGDIFERDDYMLMEITGDMTELSIIKDGLIVKTASFPKGKNLFIRRVCQEFSVDPDVSLSFIKLYYERKSEKNFHNRIEEILKESKTVWLEDFKGAFTAMKESMPAKIFLSIDSNILPFFADFLKAEVENIRRNTDIVSLDRAALSRFCIFEDNNTDSFLALESIFLNKIIHQNI